MISLYLRRLLMVLLGSGVVVLVLCVVIYFVGTQPLDRNPHVFLPLEKESKVQIDDAMHAMKVGSPQGPLNVGWAHGDITPPIGTPTLGFGARRGEGAIESDASLRATAFALQVVGQAPVVFITADLCFWPNALSHALASRLSDVIPRDHLFFGATHTHSGPGSISKGLVMETAFGDYNPAVVENVLNGAEHAIRSAMSNLSPGGTRVHEIALPQFVLNRTVSKQPVNDLAVVLEFIRDAGERAALVTYSAHATIISENVVMSSADYPGALTRRLELGAWELAGFFAAETGQAGPTLDGKLASDPGADLAHQFGERLADKISDHIQSVSKPFRYEGNLSSLRSSLALPAWSFRLPFGDRVVHPVIIDWLLGGQAPDAHVHGVALNELLLVGHGFELSSEHGVLMRAEAKARNQILVPLSFNGEHHFYVVPKNAFDAAGYEPTMAFFGPYLADYIDSITHYVARLLAYDRADVKNKNLK